MDRCEEFLLTEKENNFFHFQYKGIYFWNLIRDGIFTSYVEKLENIHPDRTQNHYLSYLRLLRHIPKQIVNKISATPKEIFVDCKNYYRDISGKRLQPYLDFLQDSGLPVQFHTSYNPLLSKDILYKGTNDVFCNIKEVFLGAAFKFIKKYRYPAKEIVSYLQMIQEKLDIVLDDDYAYSVMFLVEDFRLRKDYYSKILNVKNKCVILDEYYSNRHMALIHAAHEQGIPVIEMQHGLTGSKHIAYNCLDTSSVNKYFPSYIFTFGDYWTAEMRMPECTKLISSGYPVMDYSIDSLKELLPNQKQIVFYSQGSIGKKLSQMAVDFAKISKAEGYSIKYKLHPSECQYWRTLYPCLMDHPDIEVIDRNINVHEIMAVSKYHVGAGSTTLFEALAFQGSILIYSTDENYYVDDLVARGFATYINNEQELLREIRRFSAKDSKEFSETLFKPDSLNNIKKELLKIIS